jgi:hypothetical protein
MHLKEKLLPTPEHRTLRDDECNEDWDRGREFKRKILALSGRSDFPGNTAFPYSFPL